MLRPLLFLSALTALAGAQRFITKSSVVDISSCPITYYGQQYEQLYVNITSGYVTVCFNGFFSPETGGDCLVQHSRGAQRFEFFINPGNSLEYGARENLPTIQNSLQCTVAIGFDSIIGFLLNNYGTQAALVFFTYSSDTLVCDVQVGGTTVKRVNTTSSTPAFVDLSGCRHSGEMYPPGTVISSNPETCLSLTCNETAVLHTSSCGPLERCQGNNICVLDAICTVTGPTIIDVHSQINSIQDRCAYSLFSTPSLPDFQVLGYFKDQRRTDVSFLDSVTLRVDGHDIHLEQGGRVQLDDSTLTLDSSSQLVHGVQLSKDQTGVTAKLSLSNLNISVFFDGDTAQIHLEGPAGSSVEGLCGNSSSSLLT